MAQDRSFRRVPCRFFAAGRCQRGDQCVFLHESTPRVESSEPDHATDNSATNRHMLVRWRYQIPRATELAAYRPLGDMAITRFLKTASELVGLDTETMQEVITSLASDGGLVRINEIVDMEGFEELATQYCRTVFESRLLPLMELLSHGRVLISFAVHVRRATILNHLYGINGRKAARIFSAAAECISRNSDEEETREIGPCLIVLSGIYEVNSSADVNVHLRRATEALIALTASRVLSGAPRTALTRLKRRLGLVDDMPEIRAKNSKPGYSIPSFFMADNKPGSLSSKGVRHDNDKERIKDIQILPTAQEITSDRLEYLPGDDPAEWHLGPGIAGLVDRQFRLVREDTVGQIRDAAKAQIELLTGVTTESKQQQARTHVYQDVKLVETVFTQSKGLQYVVAFPHPVGAGATPAKREQWWEDSRRLAPEALVCLLGSNGLAVFLTVSGPAFTPPPGSKAAQAQEKEYPVHDLYKLAGNDLSAYVVLQLINHNMATINAMNQQFGLIDAASEHTFSLVEFCGVLLPAFDFTLRALQKVSSDLDLPFTDILTPPSAHRGERLNISAPAYALRPGFTFDATPLTTDNMSMRISPLEPHNAAMLARNTPLDHGQAQALNFALSHSLALIQGPPGTGKSYTGTALMKVLLATSATDHLGPILLVTYTNHALDQSLENLLDAGVKQIVRIGSRSKIERVAALSLRRLAHGAGGTRQEKADRYNARCAMEAASNAASTTLQKIHDATSDSGVMDYLRGNYREAYDQLLQDDIDDDGFTTVRNKHSSTGIRGWLEGNPNDPAGHDRQPLYRISSKARHDLFQNWREQASEGIRQELFDDVRAYQDAKDDYSASRNESDVHILSNAHVIGVTTSGLARNLEVLRKLHAKVLMVEEAGEVLEAHLITALLPSIEHAILIGDHQQLRPKAQNYELSSENPRSQINFDISLFERLAHPVSGRPSVPYVTLEIQRRMHPSISELVRSTLYPQLQDAPAVHRHREVVGMRRRLFWLDHNVKEDGEQPGMDKTSYTNSFEADVVFALVRHLIRQGVYAPENIAIITPYLGQLRVLKQKLSSFTEVVLNDRDVQDLAQIADGDLKTLDAISRRTSVAKTALVQGLKLATVDNFQGEQAEVVIISLVRSNKQRKCGFLKTSNRINVLLSRARHGMYIIGNSKTAEPVQMWHDVLELLRRNGNVGPELELCCPRHPEAFLQVSKPDDFAVVAPEAGCALMCNKQLPCGHSCESKCHSDGMHNAVYCYKECTRLKDGCTHLCPYECGRPCDKKCTQIVTGISIELPCGHAVAEPPCYQFQDITTYKCIAGVERTVAGCDHKAVVACHVDVNDPNYQCTASCDSYLTCGHVCKKKCTTCRPRVKGVATEDHGTCLQRCGRDYANCRHSCKSICHAEKPCQPCNEPCEVRCSHSKCDKKCNEPCIPCAEDSCASTCAHSQCGMPCAAPCDHVPCSRRCTQELSCGHQCPLVCHSECQGEGFCQVCAPDAVKDQNADLLMLTSYRDVDLSDGPCITTPCGHIFTLASLDGHMGMSAYYELDADGLPKALKGNSEPFSAKELKVCPNCRGSLRDLTRYGRIIRRAMLDESTKKFITWSHGTFVKLAEDFARSQDALMTSRESFRLHHAVGNMSLKAISPLLVLSKLDSTRQRYRELTNLRTKVFQFARKVQKEEQPFSRVHELVETSRRRRAGEGVESGIESFEFDNTILQTRGSLLAGSLMIRSDLIAASDITDVWTRMTFGPSKPKLEVNFAPNRKNCTDLIAKAESTMNPLQQVEGHVFWAHFAAIECNIKESIAGSEGSLDPLKQAAERHLADADALCEAFPGSTASVAQDIAEVRRMLREQSYHSQMSMVVQAMATEFSGTGHWYTCSNGHPFTVGECGMPMQTARCPQCDAPIGGRNHEPAAGVRRAADIEREFGRMHL